MSLFQKAKIKKREREGYTQQDTGYSQLRKESLQELQLVKRKERGKKNFEEKESDVKKRERRGQQKKREEENRKQSVRSILRWCLVLSFYLVVLGLGTR